MRAWGFVPASFDAKNKSIRTDLVARKADGNAIFVRDLQSLSARVSSAPTHTVLGRVL